MPKKYTSQNGNAAHTFLEPEIVCLSEPYALTISPPYEENNLKNQFSTDLTNRLKPFQDWQESIEDDLARIKYCKYTFYLETSKLGRLHLHGYIYITDIARFYMFDVGTFMSMGTIMMDIIKDFPGWHLYITKNAEIFFPVYDDYFLKTTYTNRKVKKERKKRGILAFM